VHNHPSGDPTPSCADIQMTQQIIAMASPRTQRVCDGRSGGFARVVDAVLQRYRPGYSIDPELMKGALPM
jgi:proteasome lid subunit RPN8/RPN11